MRDNARMASEPYFKAWRLFRQLTQEQAAEASGLSQSVLTRVETGSRKYNQEHLEALAIAYRCQVSDLFRDPEAQASIVDIFSRMPEDEQTLVRRMISRTMDDRQDKASG